MFLGHEARDLGHFGALFCLAYLIHPFPFWNSDLDLPIRVCSAKTLCLHIERCTIQDLGLAPVVRGKIPRFPGVVTEDTLLEQATLIRGLERLKNGQSVRVGSNR